MNILDLFLKASLLLFIMLDFDMLLGSSWAIIIQRTRILNAATRDAEAFEDKFWSGIELSPSVPGKVRRVAIAFDRFRSRSSIPGSKSSPACTAPTTMRRSR